MSDYFTKLRIREQAEFQELLKALNRIDDLNPTWTAESISVQKYGKGHRDGIYCALTFCTSDGLKVYLFNQPCWDVCTIRISKGQVMIYAADFRVDGQSYERLRDYIETAALPIQQNQDESKRRDRKSVV